MTTLRYFAEMLSGAALLLAPQAIYAEAPPLQVQVLDTLILDETKVNGLEVNELSGLAYDQQNGLLYAISDQGRLFSFALDLTNERITELKPLTGFDLVDGEGAKMSDKGFNAEGIALTGDGTMTIISEDGPNISRFSVEGAWLEDLDVPSALRDPSAQRSKNNGLESLALHPTLGVLTAPEQPLASEPRETHTIYSTIGQTFSYDTTAIGETNVKGLETLPDGRMMILERMKSTDKSVTPWLRLLDPAKCGADETCATTVAKIDVHDIAKANFEGLTQLSDDLFLIVSDDKIKKIHRSVFALLRVTVAPAAHSGEGVVAK